MMTTKTVTALAMISLLALPGCFVRHAAKPDTIVAQCQAEVAPAGTYQYEEGPGLPVMVAVQDGTEAGAAAFNTCIRQKGIALGLLANPATSKGGYCPKGSAMIYGGSTYCIGTN
ncbi:MAG: hypothetical protein AB8B82_02995 [Roseovarius sp.]